MRKTILFFIGIFFMALISCTPSPQEPEVTSPQPGDGSGGTPQEPLTGSADLVYKVDTINNYANGNIESGILEGDQEINGVFYADDTGVSFYESGKFLSGTLASERSLDIGNNDIAFSASSEINFYESGEVESGRLASTQTLEVGENDITFSSDEIFFHESGAVQSGRVHPFFAMPLPVGDYDLTFRGDIFFHESGEVESGKLDSDQTLQVGMNSITFTDDFAMTFYKDGKVKNGVLHLENTQFLLIGGLHNLTFSTASDISFHENEAISSGEIANSQTIGNIVFPIGNLNFDEDGVYLP